MSLCLSVCRSVGLSLCLTHTHIHIHIHTHTHTHTYTHTHTHIHTHTHTHTDMVIILDWEYSASFFPRSDPRTRGAQRLHHEQTPHDVLCHSFFPPTVSDWNLLPAAIAQFSLFSRVLLSSLFSLEAVFTTCNQSPLDE